MQQPLNLKEYKNELRRKIKERRRQMSPEMRQHAHQRILSRVCSLDCYRSAKTVLCYVSTSIEVDTIELIKHAFKEGKRVAVPRCIPGTRDMEFYLIESLDELSSGSFGLQEPSPNREKLLTDFTDSVCIIPALACDRSGYRLGYGGGYYDRFLRGYSQPKVLILYKTCLLKKLWHGRFDVPVDMIVTEYFIANIKHEPL
ncbi:MAG: 5-formyltetrahydrofolate cyclo-ligase [Oscillospiraceae bacterium]|nr:5-formyltetrahydrofolate cyclo-ligase [Oscillospiraceae bacterium]MBQ4538701.1 5-formyltetrahydrofolate cyclo-ligase [Oscillospiraceae bacterium]